MLRVEELVIYPIKSLRGISLKEAYFSLRGLLNDRQWMLADDAGRFITQREHCRLALVDVAIDKGSILIAAQGMSDLDLPVSFDGPLEPVTIWSDVVRAARAPSTAWNWFSDFLGIRCGPVFMPEMVQRHVDPVYAPKDARVRFADGYPGLIASTDSLEALNNRLNEPVIMRRFRPNVVVSGAPPWDEDEWALLRLGEAAISCVKPCSRCVVPTIEPDSAVKGKEPLRTLATFRRAKGHVYFGENFVMTEPGIVHLGDTVRIKTRKRGLFS